MRLNREIAIITGAASGVGKASARLFAQEGAKVVVVDLDENAAKAVAGEISATGGKAIGIGADVSCMLDVQRMTYMTVEEFGVPSILFNNAGIDPEAKRRLLDVDEATWDRIVAVNLKAPFLATKHVASVMIEAGKSGSIINTASIGAFVAAGSAGYCASKGGLVAFTRVAAVELGQYRIRVNALCPGATWTGMVERQMAELRTRGVDIPDETELAKRYSVLGRIAKPIEVARMALFLASDESSYATGAAFSVDGGMSIMTGVETQA